MMVAEAFRRYLEARARYDALIWQTPGEGHATEVWKQDKDEAHAEINRYADRLHECENSLK